jgi:hypothetical protein
MLSSSGDKLEILHYNRIESDERSLGNDVKLLDTIHISRNLDAIQLLQVSLLVQWKQLPVIQQITHV